MLQVAGWTEAARLQPRPVDPVADTVSTLAAVGAADRWAWRCRGLRPAVCAGVVVVLAVLVA